MEIGCFRKFDIQWQLPDLACLPSEPGSVVEQPSAEDWCRAFVRANIQHRPVLLQDLQLPVEVYLAFLSSDAPGLSSLWARPASCSSDDRVAQDLFASGTMTEAIVEELDRDLVPGEQTPSTDQRREMEKYFPTVARTAIFCIGCASFGHWVQYCPLRVCKACGGDVSEHLLFGCPRLSLSGSEEGSEKADAAAGPVNNAQSEGKSKGKARGKKKGKGKASENVAAGDSNVTSKPQMCQICPGSVMHLGACPMLWTTFVLNKASKRKASQISASCYVCGLGGHFGGDCTKNTGEHISGRRYMLQDDAWSAKYAVQFSGELAARPPKAGEPRAAATGPTTVETAAATTVPRRERKRTKTDAVKVQKPNEAKDTASGTAKNKGKGKQANASQVPTEGKSGSGPMTRNTKDTLPAATPTASKSAKPVKLAKKAKVSKVTKTVKAEKPKPDAQINLSAKTAAPNAAQNQKRKQGTKPEASRPPKAKKPVAKMQVLSGPSTGDAGPSQPKQGGSRRQRAAQAEKAQAAGAAGTSKADETAEKPPTKQLPRRARWDAGDKADKKHGKNTNSA